MENKENKRKGIIGEMIFIELKMFSVWDCENGKEFWKNAREELLISRKNIYPWEFMNVLANLNLV